MARRRRGKSPRPAWWAIGLVVLFVGIALAGFLGGDRAPAHDPVPVATLGSVPTASGSAAEAEAGRGGAASDAAYRYTSAEGHFQVTWPRGCDRLRIRVNEPELFADEDPAEVVVMHLVSCEQFGEAGEGCSVTATFEVKARDGSPAGPPEVLARVKNVLRAYNVSVTEQTPVRKEFPGGLVVEGVDVVGTGADGTGADGTGADGTGADGTGEFRIRGILVGPDIYVLTAWSQSGNLSRNPEFTEFFNGFLPYVK